MRRISCTLVQAKRPVISVIMTPRRGREFMFLFGNAITRMYDMDVTRKTLRLFYLINVHFHGTFFTIWVQVIIIKKIDSEDRSISDKQLRECIKPFHKEAILIEDNVTYWTSYNRKYQCRRRSRRFSEFNRVFDSID